MYTNVQPDQRRIATSSARKYARLGAFEDRDHVPPIRHSKSPVLPQISVLTALFWLRRYALVAAVLAVLGAAAGASFGILAKPRFISHADILVNPSNLKLVNDDLFTQSLQGDTQLMDVESKLRVLTSGNVLRSVVTKLDLASDPEFVPPSGWLSGLLPGADTPPADTETVALRSLAQRVTARREERSYVVVLSAWTQDSQKSVEVVNAIVDAFKQELAMGESDSAGQAAASLNGSLSELLLELTQAEDRVAAFKRENNLQATLGELTSERSVTEMANKVLDAQASIFDAETRYEDLLAAVNDGSASTSMSTSTTLSGLRLQSATLRQQVGALSRKLGPQHPTLQSAQGELQAVDRQIADEISRIVQAAKSERDLALANFTMLNEQANTMRSNVFTDNEAQVQLRALERDAAAKAATYEAFLTRASEATERQSLNSINIRVVTAPVPADGRSYPARTVLLAAVGGFLGLCIGIALALSLGWIKEYRRLSRP